MSADAELMQQPFGDGQLFDVLGHWYHADPPEDLLRAAALLYERASPSTIHNAARWLGVQRDLAEGGLDRNVVARVFSSCAAGEPPGWVPPKPVMRLVVEGAPPERSEPSEDGAKAVAFWLERYDAQHRVESIGDVARAVHERSVEVVDRDIVSLEAWNSASDSRRESIAETIVDQVEGLSFTGLETFEAGPIASFDYEGLVFRLVPGGEYDRGLSAEEEAKLRAASEAAKLAGDNWFEDHGNFLENHLHSMRPLQRVRVDPLLVCASPGHTVEPHEVSDLLESSPWRLPSEAEWEYLARGGRAHELTWRGPEVPDRAWFLETRKRGPGLANPFGCWGFGLQPEYCADAWFPTHEDAPVDATPRFGEGPRVSRGGAATLYPWQQIGEWQLLLNAVRTPSVHWEFHAAVRPTLGIRIDAGARR